MLEALESQLSIPPLGMVQSFRKVVFLSSTKAMVAMKLNWESEPRETREYDGKNYVLEGITGDYSLVKAWKGDKLGNLVFRSTARNFNVDAAKAGKICIAEVEELVEVGDIKPDEIDVPSIYVQRIIQGESYEKRREAYSDPEDADKGSAATSNPNRDRIVRRAAKEFKDGMYVNLGIGVPTLASNYIPEGMKVELQKRRWIARNGPLSFPWEEDPILSTPERRR